MPPRKKNLTVGKEKNEVIVSIVEKFNEEHGKGSAKIMSDDTDSFLFEFSSEKHIEEFRKFITTATHKSVVVEPLVNAFGSAPLARIFFEEPEAHRAVHRLMEYD